MKGTNGEQMSVHPKFKIICKNLMHDWNSTHKEQIKEQKKELTLQRLSLTLAKLFEQRPDIYTLIIKSSIDLDEW
jgi:hypothetical protein